MDPQTMMMLANLFTGGGQGSGGSGFATLLNNMFNDRRKPFAEAERAYGPNMDRAAQAYNPFYQAGTQAMGNYQQGLDKMKDPTAYLNNLMGNYKESDYAKYLQDQTSKAGMNAASASGLIDSTPFAQQMQQNAAGIASQDMDKWLRNALGINKDYLTGQSDIYGKGLTAAQGMSNVFGQRAQDEAGLAYGKEAAGQAGSGGIIGGLLKMFGF